MREGWGSADNADPAPEAEDVLWTHENARAPKPDVDVEDVDSDEAQREG